MKEIKFKNGDSMQAVGLGTWKATGDEVKMAVKEAVKAGMRHIDTAMVYQNESEIGEAIKELIDDGVVSREDLFITSKLWNDAHKSEDVLPALKESLRKLQLDSLDLYLIHWPVAFKPGVFFPSEQEQYLPLEEAPLADTWAEMERAKEQGLSKHIGVSNFSVTKLKDLISKSRTVPEVNQVELHPLLQQNDLYSYCKDNDIILTAYSPLGSGDRDASMKSGDEPSLFQIPEIKNIAEKHNVSPAQVLVGWHVQRDCSVIPKSTNPKNIRSNHEAGSLSLDDSDMETIASLDRNYRFINGKFFEAPEAGYTNVYDE